MSPKIEFQSSFSIIKALNQTFSLISDIIPIFLTLYHCQLLQIIISQQFTIAKTTRRNMPELPQVQTVRRFLSNSLLLPSKRKIKNIKIYYPTMIKSHEPKIFVNTLINQTFEEIDRYGKYLILKLNKNSIISHLRMEGKYAFYPKNQPFEKGKHDHVEFVMDDGSKLIYSDVRKFGTMVMVERGKQLQHQSIAKLGPQINDPHQFNFQYLQNIVETKKGMAKVVILDQELVCGVGNIYADEILFRARVHPQKDISKLTTDQIQAIVTHGKAVIDSAIQNKGTTFRSFSSNHETGNNQDYLKVYGKQGQKCEQCNYSVIKKIKVGGRGTHFCPTCQKI